MKKEQFDETIYMNIALDDLVTYALFSLTKKSKEATFENLVVECFELFPKKFSLVGHPAFPDSSLVNKCWLRCRTDKHLIEGSNAQGFKLTPAGLDVAEKVSFALRDSTGRTTLEKLRPEQRSRAGRFVQHVQESAAFKKYCKNSSSPNISEFELRDVLLGTMQTETNALLANIRQFIAYAKIKERADVINFLNYLEGEIKAKFESERGVTYTGGMLKRKVKSDR